MGAHTFILSILEAGQAGFCGVRLAHLQSKFHASQGYIVRDPVLKKKKLVECNLYRHRILTDLKDLKYIKVQLSFDVRVGRAFVIKQIIRLTGKLACLE